MDLKVIKAQKWKLLVNRKETPLCKSFIDHGYIHFKETSIPVKVTSCLRLSNGESYFLVKELKALDDYFNKDTITRVKTFKEKMLFYVGNLDQFSEKIEAVDFSHRSKQELIALYSEFSKIVSIATNFLVPTTNVGNVLRKKLIEVLPKASDQQKQEWLNSLVYPLQENSYVQEERSFLNLIRHYGRKEFEKLFRNHLQQFAWIGARGWWLDNAWKKEDILERVELAVDEGVNSKEVHDISTVLQERKKESEQLARKLGLVDNELLKLSCEFAYLRTWRTDVIYRAGYRARDLLYQIAQHCGFPKEDIVYLTDTEIQQMLTMGTIISNEEIQRRKQAFVLFTWKNKPEMASGKENVKGLDSLFAKDIETNEVHGTSAFPGKVKGKVKLVLTAKDVMHVKRGDILIAVMTFPHFIAAMEKASAFVTDEGGILCHAAIISREMKKPCVIGTKEGTKVFKDGDLVEVDARSGVVRKIS